MSFAPGLAGRDRKNAVSVNIQPNDRRALAAVAVQFFANGFVFASFAPRLPEIRDRLDLGIDDIGLILSVAGGASLVGSLVVGRVVEPLGTRRVILIAGIALCLALALVGWASAWPVLLAALISLMIMDVFVDVAMNLQGSWLSARRARPVISRLHGLWSLGTLLGGLLSSRLAASGLALETHLTLAAAVVLVVVLSVYRSLPAVDQGHAPTEQPTTTAQDSPALAKAAAATPRSLLVLLFLAGVFAIAAEGVPMGWAAFRVADDFAAEPQVAILGYVAFAGGMTAGRLGGDWMATVFGAHRHMRNSALVAGVGLATATLGPSVIVSLVGFVVGGLGTAALLPRMYDLAAKAAGRKGAGLGALTGGLRAADLAFPTIVGLLAAAWSSVGLALAVVVITGAVGFFVVSGFFSSD